MKGIGTKAGGKYTPPAILRAVANAARNKEARAGAGSGATATAAAVDASNPNRADWTCAKCGKSNFAKRLACFKCASPKPGRVFTAAGMKGYEKRRARREAALEALSRRATDREGRFGAAAAGAAAEALGLFARATGRAIRTRGPGAPGSWRAHLLARANRTLEELARSAREEGPGGFFSGAGKWGADDASPFLAGLDRLRSGGW